MQRVIIDIGSGNIKSYIVDENKKVVPLYKKNIMFKAHFSNEKGIDEKDKEELIKGIKDIKKLSNGKPISAYATSVFRMLSEKQLNTLRVDLIRETGLGINVISPEQEEIYMANSVGNIEELDSPYLVSCVGGSSTEMIVMKKGKILEQITEEFATGDILKKFPEIAQDKCTVSEEQLIDYIKENFKNLPTIKCENAIFTGFHLTYNTVAKNPMHKNDLFNRIDIPYYLTTEEFKTNNSNAIKNRSLEELKKAYPENPNFMNGTRGANTIVSYILENVGAKRIFPTDLNMINGIVAELDERNCEINRI